MLRQASLLRANNKALEEKAAAAEKLKGALGELRGGLEAQNRAGREAIAKREEEGRHLQVRCPPPPTHAPPITHSTHTPDTLLTHI